MKPAADAPRRRGHAFGLALDAGYEIPETAGRAPRGAPPVRLKLTRALAPGITVDHDDDGYLIRASAYGAIRVDPSGAVVVTAPGRTPIRKGGRCCSSARGYRSPRCFGASSRCTRRPS